MFCCHCGGYFYLSPLPPCQRCMWVSGLFSKKINQRAPGEQDIPSLLPPRGEPQNPRSHGRVYPESEGCRSSRDLLLSNRDLGCPPVPHHSSPMCEQVAPPAAGERDWGGGRAVSQGGRESRGGQNSLETLNEAFSELQ